MLRQPGWCGIIRARCGNPLRSCGSLTFKLAFIVPLLLAVDSFNLGDAQTTQQQAQQLANEAQAAASRAASKAVYNSGPDQKK